MGLLHELESIQDEYEDEFAESIMLRTLPHSQIPETASDPRAVRDLLRAELDLDGNAGQNLATFCTTYDDEDVRFLMDTSINKNMIDKDEYPQSAEIERRCVSMLADLWHSPEAANTIGCSTEGSSEACMLGGLALKQTWRNRRAAQSQPTDRPNLVCGAVQICWHKFARYFDVELRQVPLREDGLGMNAADVASYCDENTIGVVSTLGVTFTGVYEPVKELAVVLDDLQQRTGLNIPIHVDAASGGFIAPFVQDELEWDFRIDRVKSINASGHKYGLAPLGVGWIVWRDLAELPEELIFHVNYLGGDMPTFALNFSRPAGQIISQYYLLVRHGREGYRDIQQICFNVAQEIARELPNVGPFEVLYDGIGGLPAVCYKLSDDSKPFSLYDLTDRLRMRGWQVPSYPLPANRQDLTIQRILIRHGMSGDLATLLLDDISTAVKHLSAGHPEQTPLFHHS